MTGLYCSLRKQMTASIIGFSQLGYIYYCLFLLWIPADPALSKCFVAVGANTRLPARGFLVKFSVE